MATRTSIDFKINYQEGGGFAIFPRSMQGRSYEDVFQQLIGESEPDITQSIYEEQLILCLETASWEFYVRVIVGSLTLPESEEWVAKASGKLQIPCGQLTLCNALDPDEHYYQPELKTEQPEAKPRGSYDICYVNVPAGEYQVEVYSYPPFDVTYGWNLLTDVGAQYRSYTNFEPPENTESLEAYFHRTRPNIAMPDWIQDEFANVSRTSNEIGEVPYITCIICLSAVEPEFEASEFDDTGFLKWQLRKPIRCPLGIPID